MPKAKYNFTTDVLTLRSRREAVFLCGMMKRVHFETEKWPSVYHLKALQEDNTEGELATLWRDKSRDWFKTNPVPGKYEPRWKPKTAVKFLREKVGYDKIKWPGGYTYDPGSVDD